MRRTTSSQTKLNARVATAAKVRTELQRREPNMSDEKRGLPALGIWLEGLDSSGLINQIDNLCVN